MQQIYVILVSLIIDSLTNSHTVALSFNIHVSDIFSYIFDAKKWIKPIMVRSEIAIRYIVIKPSSQTHIEVRADIA